MREYRHRLFSVLCPFLLCIALALSATPARAQNCEKHPDHPRCDGGGGGDGGQINIEAGWTDSSSVVSETGIRNCVPETIGDEWGIYKCEMSVGQTVSFGLVGGTETDKHGNPQASGICDEFDGVTMAPNTNYEINWLGGPCTTVDGCEIRVLNWFNNVDGAPRPDETGLIIVEGFGPLAGTSDINPFSESQTVPVNLVRITVKQEGTNKTYAVCEYDTSGGATFESDPVVP